MFRKLFSFVLAALLLVPATVARSEERAFFAIQVIDEATGRGVPLVQLQTTDKARYYTDSNGYVAFNEPGLMGEEVWFTISSHGYEFPRESFGKRGITLKITSGGKAQLKIRRNNIAERLYRGTGQPTDVPPGPVRFAAEDAGAPGRTESRQALQIRLLRIRQPSGTSRVTRYPVLLP